MLSAPTMTAQRQQWNWSWSKPLFRRAIAVIALAPLLLAPLAAPAATTQRIIANRFSGLAIDGFDPVSYFVDGQALIGLPDFEAAGGTERLRDVPRHPGLHGLLGYASRGLIWAPLCAELLAARLENEPLPLESALVDALDPARFVLRARRTSRFPQGSQLE